MMGVVFDQVEAVVDTPPPQEEPEPDADDEQKHVHRQATSWQRLEATFRRRQQRLEAD
ncbi:MAG: hypothetical protein ACQEUB_03740 [Thermodesulfobacteriota bacterium]